MLIIDVNGDSREMNPDGWFKNVFDENLLMEEFPKRMIKEISKCEVISPYLVISDILGGVSSEWIGSGCKAVLAMKYADPEDGVVNLKWCGDNLVPYIREVVEDKDVVVHCSRLFPIFSKDYGEYSKGVMVKNSGKICYSALELYDEIDKFLGW